MTTEAFVYDAIRTPRGRGKKNGSLHETKPVSLVVGLIDETPGRNPDLDPARSRTSSSASCRRSATRARSSRAPQRSRPDSSDSGPGVQLNRFCASGLEAVNTAAAKIRSGWEDLVLAGGVESMSRVPMGSDGGAWATDPETAYETSFVPQGISADLIATIEGFTREDVDAVRRRVAGPRRQGPRQRLVRPIGRSRSATATAWRCSTTTSSRGRAPPSSRSAACRPPSPAMGEMGGFDAVALQKYHWVEKINHVHTAGNSLGHRRRRRADGHRQRAGRPRARADPARPHRGRRRRSPSEPTIMLTGPAPATRKALAKAGLTVDDIDLFEVNEAFAAVVLKFMKDLGVPHEKVNVNGGAIALGHPLGATGAMILGTLIDELERRDLRYGLATLCVGGGMGIATIVERV